MENLFTIWIKVFNRFCYDSCIMFYITVDYRFFKRLGAFLVLLALAFPASGQQFSVIALGCNGGITDNNLSAWLVKPADCQRYLLLDAGSLTHGIDKACANGLLPGFPVDGSRSPLDWTLKEGIEACLISHPHFDHFAGLVAVSPDDVPKPVYGSPSTLLLLQKHVFNNAVWANFSDQGESPRIGKYRFVELSEKCPTRVGDQGVVVTEFPLSHGGMRSSAFLLNHCNNFMLYFGDTGADVKESSSLLRDVWQEVAPLIAKQVLEIVVIEVSYPDPRPDNLLFGHLTPSLLAGEIQDLTELIPGEHPEKKLEKVLFVITHVKPVAGRSNTLIIENQLKSLHIPGFRFVMAGQGMLYSNEILELK